MFFDLTERFGNSIYVEFATDEPNIRMGGSLCWFIAFTLQNAAYVRAVGQVELVFSALVSWLVFRERAGGRELAGIGMLGLSILLLVLLAG